MGHTDGQSGGDDFQAKSRAKANQVFISGRDYHPAVGMRKIEKQKALAIRTTVAAHRHAPWEATGLRWRQVDIGQRIIDLPVTKITPRRVPVSIPALEALLSVVPDDDWQCDSFVFLPDTVSGRMLASPSVWFRRVFVNALQRAGIEDFHQQDLRYTVASYLLMSGVDLRTLAEILGHSSTDMVQRYTHLLDRHKIGGGS